MGTTASGSGGNAISVNTATILIDGTAGPVTITGGSAGSLTSGGVGAGIYGSDLSVTLRGDVTVTGGTGQGGGWDMVLLGTSTLTLEADASGNSPTLVNVNPVNTGTLVLTGSNNGSAAADLTSRFDTITKTGSSTWTLTDGSRVSAATAWNLTEGTLAVSSSNIFVSGATITFGGATLGATETMTVASAVSFGSGTGTFQVAASKTLTVSGALSGNQAFSKTGTGTLTLTNANSNYYGSVSVSAGTLALSGSGSLSAASGITIGAGTLDISATTSGATVNNLSSSDTSAQVVLGSQTLTVNPTSQNIFSGVISGIGGGLTVSGTSDLFLTGDNTYTGTTTVNGFLTLGNASASGSVAGNIVVNSSGLLNFSRTDTYTINNSITSAAGSAVTSRPGGHIPMPGAESSAAPLSWRAPRCA